MIDRRALLGAGLFLPVTAGAQSWRAGWAPGFRSGLRFLSQAAVAYTTWNPADKSANIALSNNNLAASGSGSGSVRSVAGKNSGKFYYEAQLTTLSSTSVLGLASGTFDVTTSLGGSNGFGYYSSGLLSVNGNSAATYATYGVGDIISFAFDVPNKLAWVAKNGVWQAGNPATGTGGVSISYMTQVFAAFTPNANNAGSANFGATAFIYTPPTGFTGLTTGST